ncbi:hypothetical protein OIU89_23565 [Escherichia coli]|nr:hypothetical protein [Escherichia coli]
MKCSPRQRDKPLRSDLCSQFRWCSPRQRDKPGALDAMMDIT